MKCFTNQQPQMIRVAVVCSGVPGACSPSLAQAKVCIQLPPAAFILRHAVCGERPEASGHGSSWAAQVLAAHQQPERGVPFDHSTSNRVATLFFFR